MAKYKLYYCNVSFDSELFTVKNDFSDKFQRLLYETTLYFIGMGTEKDKILIDCDVDDEYLHYLDLCGISLPQIVKENYDLHDYDAFPWGWNETALKRFKKFNASCNHPPLDIIAKLNSRSYCFNIANRYNIGVPNSRFFSSYNLLWEFLHKSTFPVVIKPEYGNAGRGFVIINSERELYDKKETMKSMFKNKLIGVYVEPWLNRVLDISALTYIDSHGSVSSVKIYQTLNNRFGTFYGIRLRQNNEEINKWKPILIYTVDEIVPHLHQEGYFGALSIDSFIWQDYYGKKHIVPLVELNLRNSISTITFELQNKIAKNRECLLFFVPRKRYKLSNNYNLFLEKLGEKQFNIEAKEGIILLTPLYILKNNIKFPIQRPLFFIAAKTEKYLNELNKFIKDTFSKK